MLPFPSCATCPAAGVQRAGSAVSRLTLPLMQAVSVGWSCPLPPGSRRCSYNEMGAGARSRPARRRSEPTARGTAPVRAAASSSSGQGLSGAVAHAGRRGCSARRAGRRMEARWSSAAWCLDAAAGRRLLALPADGGTGSPARTGFGWLARGRPCVLPGRRYRMQELCGQSPAAPDRRLWAVDQLVDRPQQAGQISMFCALNRPQTASCVGRAQGGCSFCGGWLSFNGGSRVA
jgi:hypothetical protein